MRPYLFGGLLLLAIGALPSLVIGLPTVDIGAHDQDIALRWLSGFSHAMQGGILWPRWLIDDQFGFGSPSFFFYPPLSYMVASILMLVLRLNADMGIRLGMALFATIGFVLAWRLARRLGAGRQAPLLAGLYVASPWLAFVDQVSRGAFAEYASVAVLPLVGMVLLAPPARFGLRVVATAGAYALLILTSLPIAVLAAAAGLLCVLLSADLRRILCFLAGMLLAGALAAPLLVPAMTMQNEISPQFWVYSSPAQSVLLFGGQEFGKAMTAMRYGCFGVFAVAALVLTPWRRASRNLPLTVLVLCLLGTTILSWPAWRYLPLLSLVQLPVRLFAVVPLFWIMALAVRGGIPRGRGFWAASLLPAAMTVALTGGVLLGQAFVRNFPLKVLPSDRRVLTALQQPLLQAPEYLPSGASGANRARVISGIVLLDRNGWQRDLPKLVRGTGSVTETRTAGGFTLDVTCPSGCRVVSRQFWFPGWYSEGVVLHRDPATGMVAFNLPAVARRVVTVRRVLTPQERRGFAICLIALVVCLGLVVFSLRRVRRSRNAGMSPAAQ